MFAILSNTVFYSLLIQFLTGIAGFDGIFRDLPKEDMILREVLIMEMIVQVIEFIFYLWLAFGIYSIQKNKNSSFPLLDITKRRYIDWVITTPTMLVSTIIFLEYLKREENYQNGKENEKEEKPLEFREFISEHRSLIFTIFLSNLMMLLFGYFVEIGRLDKFTGISIGFVFLLITFGIMYQQFAKYTKWGKRLFYFMFSVWSLYGIAAIFQFYFKNISYNILDIFAKNFFGLFLYFVILRKQSLSSSLSK